MVELIVYGVLVGAFVCFFVGLNRELAGFERRREELGGKYVRDRYLPLPAEGYTPAMVRRDAA